MDKQKEVAAYLSTVEQATKSDIYENVSFGYYHNWEKHLGELLSRMVKNKSIERVKIGVYRLVKKEPLPIQNSLFGNVSNNEFAKQHAAQPIN